MSERIWSDMDEPIADDWESIIERLTELVKINDSMGMDKFQFSAMGMTFLGAMSKGDKEYCKWALIRFQKYLEQEENKQK